MNRIGKCERPTHPANLFFTDRPEWDEQKRIEKLHESGIGLQKPVGYKLDLIGKD